MRSWIHKFRCAFRGIYFGVYGQSSFAVHAVATGLVVLLAWWGECSLTQWCILIGCIGVVLGLEMMNSAIELLAKGLCTEHNPEVGKALDAASASVLIVSMMAALIGCLVLGSQLFRLEIF